MPELVEVLRDYLTAHGWHQTLDGRWLPKGANTRKKHVVFVSLMGAVQQQLEEEYYDRQRARLAAELGRGG